MKKTYGIPSIKRGPSYEKPPFCYAFKPTTFVSLTYIHGKISAHIRMEHRLKWSNNINISAYNIQLPSIQNLAQVSKPQPNNLIINELKLYLILNDYFRKKHYVLIAIYLISRLFLYPNLNSYFLYPPN